LFTLITVLIALPLIGWLVVQSSSPRRDEPPLDPTTAMTLDARQDRIDQANAALSSDPHNIEALTVLSYDALLYRDLDAAMRHMDTARELAPNHPGVLVNLAILQFSVGMTDRAIASFDSALLVDPNFCRALLWKGYLLAELDQRDDALSLLTSSQGCLTWFEEKEFVTALLADLTAPLPQQRLTGIVSLSDGIEMPDNNTLFVIARRAETGGGPPVAVQKITDPDLPFTFSLGDEHMFMGGQWPQEVWIEARLDQDGDAMTKSEEDLGTEMLGPLISGTQDISLTLQ